MSIQSMSKWTRKALHACASGRTWSLCACLPLLSCTAPSNGPGELERIKGPTQARPTRAHQGTQQG
jgi:hypothetical protein